MVRILLVEDNELVRNTMSALITMEEHFILSAETENGTAAMDLLINGLEVDVVLTDLNMPEMDGIELTQKILAFDERIKVIILTMHNKWVFVERAMEAGALGYLLKNGNLDQLFNGITQVYNGESIIGADVRKEDDH